jgi:uncharacterized protein (UPF0332 family)
MAFNWTDFLVLAREIGARADQSALRSAVSRAYYAAFKTAEHYCERNGFPPVDTGRPHQDVWDAFFEKGGKTFTSVYEKGDRLRRKRAIADYRSHQVTSASTAQDCLRDSYAILSYLGASPPPPPR